MTDKFEALEARLVALELENKRLHAIQDVTNVISKMAYFQEAGMFQQRYECLARRDDTTVEIGCRGVFVGYESCRATMITHEENFVKAHSEGVRKTYPERVREMENDHSGMIESSVTGTPVIEVAADAKTARGQWMSMMLMAKSRGAEPESGFVWWKTAADFIFEDGRWWVWHLRMDPVITGQMFDFAANSVKMPEPVKPGSPWVNLHNAGASAEWPVPDMPVTEMYYTYRPWTTAKNYPTPPEPYETFDEVKNW